MVITGLGQSNVCESLLRGQGFVWNNVKWGQKEQKEKQEPLIPVPYTPSPRKTRERWAMYPTRHRRGIGGRVVHSPYNAMLLPFLFGAGCDSGCRHGFSVLALLHGEVNEDSSYGTD